MSAWAKLHEDRRRKEKDTASRHERALRKRFGRGEDDDFRNQREEIEAGIEEAKREGVLRCRV